MCLDYPNVTSGIRKLITKTYIKWLNRIPHCHHGYPHARHTSSVLKSKVFNPTIKKPQRERLNSSQEYREGRNTIWSNYINKAHDTSRSCQIKNTREREREREIKHIATGTYPQPRGWTTPSSSWRPSGWWRWPPVMVSSSGRVPEQGSGCDRFSTVACGGGVEVLGFFLGVSRFIRIFRVGFTPIGVLWDPRAQTPLPNP